MKTNLFILFLLVSSNAFAQSAVSDTIPALSEIVIQGFETNRKLLETPVSAGVITSRDLQKFSTVSMLPAINMTPGVRMEERSPGSYRLSIRGSLLRSPFGVRNIKVYWNDIPFTDAGGNTYFNLIDQNTIGQIEILKGPGSSMYGANTGGVIILHSNENQFDADKHDADSHQLQAQVSGGSYGLFGENLQWKYTGKKISSSFTQSHIQADGYRENSRLRRDVVQWNGAAQLSGKDKLSWILMYADMYYQTPGGLTLQQMNDNPRQARPSTPVIAGAKEQKAAIYNKTPFTGLSNQHVFNEHWSNTTSVTFSYTDFKNPFILNYEKRYETNVGVRTKFSYHKVLGIHDIKITTGAEWQYNYSVINNYDNKGGVADAVQYKDKIGARQVYPFIQGGWQIGEKVQLQAGASTNFFTYHYQRLTDVDDAKKKKVLNEQLLPRFAALYRITKNLSLYSSVSKGFSPPSIAEVRPSEGSIYTNLKPEYGWNYELGFRGKTADSRLQFDIVAYQFKLQDALVRRTDNNGAEYFVNAGGTDQKGLEFSAGYTVIQRNEGFVRSLQLSGSATLNDFRFTHYQVNGKDYSGNALTGVAKHIYSGGIDMRTAPGLYLFSSFVYTSKLPLLDDNTVFASPYRLLSARLGWLKKINALSFNLFAGIDNALNQLYSLGNDINAAGNRFYNPAPGRNYYGGIAINF
ncbi:TonB-dependent receptor [Terrimonas sp.]|uniref:TonB-dependent receptor n=1 Tax=Terrimonas sp. TaxID=1914338 RepID=UPI001056EE10|nr:TonB-dependent receptor [Terrimonas sp.]